MNANELADEFKEENNDWNEDDLRHWGKETEAMLRQQQVEIEALKEKVDELAGYKASYENCHRACNGYGMN